MADKLKKKTANQPALVATPKKPAKKTGELRKPQVRVLQALAKSKTALSRAEISVKGKVDRPMLNSYIGAHDEKIRAKNDKLMGPSLLTRGYVKYAPEEEGRGAAYVITAAGRKALGKE